MPKKRPLKERFLEKVEKSPTGCWEWKSSIARDGYGRFMYEGKNWKASRVSYLIFKGEFDLKKCVMHTCDNRKCVNPDHLVLGTHKENMADMRRKKRASHGERSGTAKLTEPMVAAIRVLYETKILRTHREVASAFGIAASQACYILNRKQWKYTE